MATGSYYRAECNTCNVETWHYKSVQGETFCTKHGSNILTKNPAANAIVKTKIAPLVVNRLDRSLWRMTSESHSVGAELPADLAKGLFSDEAEIADPNKLTCSFCGAEVDRVNVLEERKPKIRIQEELYEDSDGNVQTKQVVTSKMERIHACPNCVLNIRRPIVVRTV